MTTSLTRLGWRPVLLLALAALIAAAAFAVATTQAAPPDDLAAAISLDNESDNVVKAGSTITVVVTTSYTVEGEDDPTTPDVDETVSSAQVPVDIDYSDFTLRSSGAFDFENSGRNSVVIDIDGTTGPDGSVASTVACTAPADDKVVDGIGTHTCALVAKTLAIEIRIPVGTPDGTFTISTENLVATVDDGDADTDDTKKLAASLDVTVGDVNEIDSVTFGVDTDQKDSIGKSGSTVLVLGVLNANGKAVANSSIASILVTTSVGDFSTALGGDEDCDEGPACTIDIEELTQTGGTSSAAIKITYTAPDEAGSADIDALVIATNGVLTEATPITITFAGDPETIAVAGPASTVLNVDSDDFDESGDGDDPDTRNTIALAVTSSDEVGNAVPVKRGRETVKVLNADGKAVAGTSGNLVFLNKAGADVDELADDAEEGADVVAKVEARIAVTAGEAVDAGDYTVQVKSGGFEASATVTLAGEAANVSLSSEGSGAFGTRVTLTATVTDADGNAAADGTAVSWVTPESDTLVTVSEGGKTKGGQASAVYVVFGTGASFVSAAAGSGSDVVVIGQGGAVAAPAETGAAGLSVVLADNYSTYVGSRSTSASALHRALGGNFSAIRLWNGSEWLRYSPGIPGGGVDFRIMQGDVLWLSR